jgi:hypothetical protein
VVPAIQGLRAAAVACGIAQQVQQRRPALDLERVRRAVDAQPDGVRTHERWSRRYARAVARMRDAGIATRADQKSGLREYVELRVRWEPAIESLADALGWSLEEVDRFIHG